MGVEPYARPRDLQVGSRSYPLVGLMGASTMESGKTTLSTEKVATHGKMERSTLGNMLTRRSTDSEYSHGPLVESTRVSGAKG